MSEPSAHVDDPSARCGRYAALAALGSAAPKRAPRALTPSEEDGGGLRCPRCQGVRGWERLLGSLKTQLTNP
jgi:hypothetical protein